jgi:FkbM family methyltransferase
MLRKSIIDLIAAVVRFSPLGRRRTYGILPLRVQTWIRETPIPHRLNLRAGSRNIAIPDSTLTSIFKTYYWQGIGAYEPATSEFVLQNASRYDWFADVGAYLGHYSILFAAAHPGAPIRSFEPVPHNAEAFRQIIKENDLAIDLRECAVSDRTGTSTLYIPTKSSDRLPSSASLNKSFAALKAPEKYEVGTVPLSEALSGLSGRGLVKIDAESAEGVILSGSPDVLSVLRPDIILEVIYPAETDYAAVAKALAGYRVSLIHTGVEVDISRMTLEQMPYRKHGRAEGWGEAIATPR